MAMEQEKKQETTGGGIGLGLGVDLNLKLNQLTDLVHTLNDALRETGSTVTGLLSDTIHKIKEIGPEILKEAKGQEGFSDQYNQLVSSLRQAADRGEEEARNLLSRMGEGVEHAGEFVQEKAKPEETTH